MKSNYYILLPCFILFSSIPKCLIAQSNQEELLKGAWVFDYDTSILKINTKAQTYLNKIQQNPQRLSKLESAYKGRKITFSEDGVFFQELANGKKVNALWALKNNTQIELIHGENTKITYKIEVLSNEQLVIKKISKTAIGNPLFTSHYYKKEQ